MGVYDELVAGLWRKRLPYQLLWRILNPSPRPVEWQAPSWSWASVNGQIDPQVSEHYFLWQPDKTRQEQSLIKVIDIALEYKDNDAKQRLIGASLRLWAPIVSGYLRPEEDFPGSTHVRLGTENVLTQFKHDHNLMPEPDKIYTLMLILYTNDDNPEYYGIWIEPSSETPGEWSRIGFCNVTDYIWKGNIENLERLLGKGLEDISNVLGSDLKNADGIPRYLIELV
jgi:hypothetical protein